MSRHRTDLVAFVFGIAFLLCAGAAVGVRTGNLGIGDDGPDGAWIAGTVLAVAGLVGLVGTLSSLRSKRVPAGPAAVEVPGDAPPVEPITAESPSPSDETHETEELPSTGDDDPHDEDGPGQGEV